MPSKSLKKRILKKLGLYKSPPQPQPQPSQTPRDVIHVTRKQLENFQKNATESREHPMFIDRTLPKKTSPSESVKLAMKRYSVANVAAKTNKMSSSKKGGKKRKTVKKKSYSWW
jgi:hypothetical protein